MSERKKVSIRTCQFYCIQAQCPVFIVMYTRPGCTVHMSTSLSISLCLWPFHEGHELPVLPCSHSHSLPVSYCCQATWSTELLKQAWLVSTVTQEEGKKEIFWEWFPENILANLKCCQNKQLFNRIWRFKRHYSDRIPSLLTVCADKAQDRWNISDMNLDANTVSQNLPRGGKR